MKMTPQDFTKVYYPYALQCEKSTGISALAILAQAAWESGWGEHTIDNNFFGQKDSDKDHSNAKLVTTTEYSSRADLKFPEIISITPYTNSLGQKKYKYLIKDWFTTYSTPAEGFEDHAQFFIRNPRYSQAMKVKVDPELFIQEVSKAGYATDPNYDKNLISIVHTLKKFI
jgi:flagellar protein FlgJ